MKTFKARKVSIFQLFFVYPISIRIHFFLPAFKLLPAGCGKLFSSDGHGDPCPDLHEAVFVQGVACQLLLHPPEQEEVHQSKASWLWGCQRCSMLWLANQLWRTVARGADALSQWKYHSFYRDSKDRLSVTHTGGLQLNLWDKLF